MRGSIVQCSRFGCVVRLEDGRFATLPAGEPGFDVVKRAMQPGRHPAFPFVVAEESGRRIRVSLDLAPGEAAETPQVQAPERFSASLEQKIIDFWRQVSDWDRNAGRVDEEEAPRKRSERLLPFDERAPRQYRELPKRSRKGLKSARHNR